MNTNWDIGVDAWTIKPRQPARPAPGSPLTGSAFDDHNNLLLPDADNQWNYRPVAPWLRFSGNLRISSTLEANFKLRADQLMGAHLDVANLDWAPSPFLGLRAGVVNFNTNWCRTYDVDSPWISEPDAFCRSQQYMRINNAAPGLQGYTNSLLEKYQVQAMVGVYRPLLGSYDTKEFGFNNQALGPNFQIDFNRKTSAAVNLLNLHTGTQLRLGWMRSDQGGAYNPLPQTENRSRRNHVDNYYFGADGYLRPTLRLRYSFSKFASRDFYDALLVVQDKDRSTTWELLYDWKATDLVAVGRAKFTIAAAVDDALLNYQSADYYHLNQAASMVSWRHQWGKGVYSTLQWTHASQINGYEGRRRPSSGDALGLRLAYQY